MAEDNAPPAFSADQPVTNPTDDKLDRDRFSAAIARSLANWKGHESLILSLSGEWGSGKSTIKNFVKHHLGKRVETLEFNPWQWSGQDKLLEGFLWQLGKTFGKKDIAKKARALAEKWEAFAPITKVGGEISHIGQKLILGLLSLSVMTSSVASMTNSASWIKWATFTGSGFLLLLSLSTAISEKVSTLLNKWAAFREKSLEDLRSEIETELRKLDKPIIVFVDDVDRLSKEEIKLLFQLIKSNAHFPNLVYFLLFQKDIVVKALAEITSDDGSKYLRKIVQVELDVPIASARQMQTILTSGLDAILTSGGVKIRWAPEYWQSIFLDDLWPYFRNLRDIKRFLGSFEFYFSQHVNDGVLEVNPVDLIAIETLRLFDHGVFQALSQFFPKSEHGLAGRLYGTEVENEAAAKIINEIAEGAAESTSDKERLKHLLHYLFPQSTGHSERNEWKRDLRICEEFSFYKYFRVTIDTAKPTALEINRFVEKSADRHRSVEFLNTAIKNNTIEEFLELIFAARDDIPVENMTPVSTALFDVGDNFPVPKPSLLAADLDMQCTRIIYHRLKGEHQDRSTELLWKAYQATTGFILPIHHLYLESKGVRERNANTSFVISEARLDDFISLTLQRIGVKAEDSTLVEHKELGFVLYRWREWAGKDEVTEWLTKVIRTPDYAIKVMRALMAKRIINGVKEEFFLRGDAMEALLDLETLYAAIKNISVETLESKDAICYQLVADAMKLKSEGKPYDEVNPKGSFF